MGVYVFTCLCWSSTITGVLRRNLNKQSREGFIYLRNEDARQNERTQAGKRMTRLLSGEVVDMADSFQDAFEIDFHVDNPAGPDIKNPAVDNGKTVLLETEL